MFKAAVRTAAFFFVAITPDEHSPAKTKEGDKKTIPAQPTFHQIN